MANMDFEELSVHQITEFDFDGVKKFLQTDFLHSETLNNSVSLSAEEADELFNDLINDGIASSLSFLLKNPDGEIVALRLATIIDRPEEESHSEHNDITVVNKNATNDKNTTSKKISSELKRYCPKALLIADILHEMESKIWILIDPRLKRLLLWTIISVHKDYTRRGLARKLLTYKLDEAQQMGCQGCVAVATAIKSQSLLKKMGCEMIYEIKHDKWLDDKGQQIFHCNDNTTSIQLTFKPFL